VSDGPDTDANRLGALALRLADRIDAAVTDDGDRSSSAAAALTSIERFFATPPSIESLRRVLGLSHAGAVRLVDSLAHNGLVSRRPGDDRRARRIGLTDDGRRAKVAITAARARVLDDALAVLDDDERRTFAVLVDKVLTGLVNTGGGAPAMCRLCATEACGAAVGQPCPVTLAALGASGSSDVAPGESSA
jgi:MarR family transcriptional regulator, negative regulator of the multidrug operon emrRAB